jgi:hypothetical protein
MRAKSLGHAPDKCDGSSNMNKEKGSYSVEPLHQEVIVDDFDANVTV